MKNRMLRRALAVVAMAGLSMASALSPVHAGSFTFITPSGSTTSGPVDASVTFVTSANSLQITLTDLQANPTDVAQLLSDLHFTAKEGTTFTGASLSSSSGQELTVAKDGTFTLGSTVDAGWAPALSGNAGILDALTGPGHAGPSHLIIGPPGPGGDYANANGSIAGNKAHNPFLNQVATFTITGSNISADTVITGATFSFGTTAGVNIVGQAVPEPGSLALGAVGFGFVGAIGFYRSRRRAPR